MSDTSKENTKIMNRRRLNSPALFIGCMIGIGVGIGFSLFFQDLFLGSEDKKTEVIVPIPPVVTVKEQEPPIPEPKSPIEDAITLEEKSFKDLAGWTKDDLSGVEIAFERSCKAILKKKPEQQMGRGHVAIPMVYGDWQPICARFMENPALHESENFRAFLESETLPFLAANNTENAGKFTGYFEAELRGSREKSEIYKYPLYGKPKDLVSVNLGVFSEDLKGRHVIGRVNKNQRFEPYHKRELIEAGGIDTQQLELIWIDDAVDVFLLQVQGSGRVILPDGEVVRVGYAAHNGHKYQSIGRYLIKEGEIDKHKASWRGIRTWIEENPEKQANLFSQNPRFVFFRVLDGDGPIGSQGVALTPKRSLAVDQRYIPLGSLVWLDSVQPGMSKEPLQTLMVAQDTGGAIKGPVRGDFFWGYGDKALSMAGSMNSKGRYFILLPHATAARIASVENQKSAD